MTSVRESSRRNWSIGPYPRMSSETSRMSWALSAADSGARSVLVAAFDAERLIGQLQPYLPAEAQVLRGTELLKRTIIPAELRS